MYSRFTGISLFVRRTQAFLIISVILCTWDFMALFPTMTPTCLINSDFVARSFPSINVAPQRISLFDVGRASRNFSAGRSIFATAPTTLRKISGFFVVASSVGAYAYCNATSSPLYMEANSIAGIKGTDSERTFIMVKPDGVTRGLVGEIISRFEKRGYKLVGIKSLVPSKQLAEQHYADLKSRPFFRGLVEYITDGKAPVVAMVWEGKDVIRQGRTMIGATNPLDSAPGTIRGEYAISIGRNIIHGSDSFDSAEKEISLWFSTPGEITQWKPPNWNWIMADN